MSIYNYQSIMEGTQNLQLSINQLSMGVFKGGGNWGTLRIPREDWGTLGNIRED